MFPAIILCTICFIISSAAAQQSYINQSAPNCDGTFNDSAVPTINGYSCNGKSSSCEAYLTFKTQSPYNNVSSISSLLSVNSSVITEQNGVSNSSSLKSDRSLVIPINCSCKDQYYQLTASYQVRPNDTYYAIATDVYQGLTTCRALMNQNKFKANELPVGVAIAIPLRCACPTEEQVGQEVNYLLTHAISLDESVSEISKSYRSDTRSTLEANRLCDNCTIYPNTTVLVPLRFKIPKTPGPRPKRTWVYILATLLPLLGLGIGALISVKFALFDKCILINNLVINKKEPVDQYPLRQHA